LSPNARARMSLHLTSGRTGSRFADRTLTAEVTASMPAAAVWLADLFGPAWIASLRDLDGRRLGWRPRESVASLEHRRS
jgi:hypothetical protein